MTVRISKRQVSLGALARRLMLATALAPGLTAYAHAGSSFFSPGNLVVGRSEYDNNSSNVQVGETLPPNCAVAGSCVTATNDGTYPLVFNNNLADGNFGVTSRIFLDQLTPSGTLVNSLVVPNSRPANFIRQRNQMVTSFSSKSEMALNLSTDHSYVTLMGYFSPIDALDVSDSNSPGVVDPTNPVGGSSFREVAQVDVNGNFKYTVTNAYSGNNGRAAILNNSGGANFLFTAGNAGNGGNPQPNGVIIGAGAQIMNPQTRNIVTQRPGAPTPVGSFNITQIAPNTADKIGKDTNFRGMTLFNNVLYFTKGSGGNGINSVYFLDTTGTVCSASNGVGLPVAGATLPNAGIPYDPSLLQTEGVTPYNMCILNGFNTTLAKKTTNVFPFGIWFANATTLYLADEGSGDNTNPTATSTNNGTYTNAAAQTTAGLQKWTFNGTSWVLAYTLQAGLNLGTPYVVPGYPTGLNAATGLPWAPATDGLRNITGSVNGDGTATIYAITSTVSGNGDQGADPNQLVAITDNIAATTPPPEETFTTVQSAANLEVLRGVSFTPGT